MGIAIRSTITRSVLILVAVVAVAMTYSQPANAAKYAKLDSTSPNPSNSAPQGIFHHRMRYNELGQFNDVKFDVYTNTNTQNTIHFDRVDCLERYLGGVGANTDIVRVTFVGATSPAPITITAGQLCSGGANDLFRAYPMPVPKLRSSIAKYYVSVTVEYINPQAYLDKNVSGDSRNAIGFTARVTGDSTAKIAPVSGGGRNYSLLANTTGGSSSFRLPFALACGTAGGTRKPIKIYDADVTTLFGALEVQIFKTGTEEAVPLYRNSQTIGQIDSTGTKFTAGSGNAVSTEFEFIPDAGQKYVIKISSLYNGNAIDLGLPGGMDTIYGAVPCIGGGYDLPLPPLSVSVTPNAQIDGSDLEPGEGTTGSGSALVEDYPDTEDWPFYEVAQQRAKNTGIVASRVYYDTKEGEEATGSDADKSIQCADGVYRAPSNCGDLGRFRCNDGVDRDSCGTYNWVCNKKASAGGGLNYYNSSAVARIPGDAPANCQTSNSDHDIKCSDGNYRNPVNCVDLGTFKCNDGVGRDSCATYNWSCTWSGDTRYVNDGANTIAGMTGCKIFKYYCKDTNGNYLSSGTNFQYKDFNNKVRAECNNKWDCPSPSPVVGFGADDASANCRIFQCIVYTDVSYGTFYEAGGIDDAHKRCDFRCSSSAGWGTGVHAPLATNSDGKWGSGDLNCYQQPSFTLTCAISNGSTTTNVSVTVQANGMYCTTGVSAVASGAIGSQVCVTTSITSPPNGALWYGPANTANNRAYYFSVAAPDQSCVTVVAKPTFKVLGGDVAVGSTFASTNPCTDDFSNSSIVGWPGVATGYNGSHTEFGAFASGSVAGFASSKKQGWVPRGLTFANTIGSGEIFGGGYGAMPCMTNHAALIPVGVQTRGNLNAMNVSGSYNLGSSQIASPPIIAKQQQLIVYKTGNLYIKDNILYDRSGWSSVDDIPALKVVVTGNIYIDQNVTELNGLYVAQPDSAGDGGRIYTCASGPDSPVANDGLYNSCNKTLNVNGAFVAKRVVLGRSFGTQRLGTTAEIFNYLPELWLTKWPQAGSSNELHYDSMTNLPPVL